MVFTGLTATRGRTSFDQNTNMLKVTLCDDSPAPNFFKGAEIGSSVMVQGVCLTVLKLHYNDNDNADDHGECLPLGATFFVQAETRAVTTLNARQMPDFVNLERSLQVGSSLCGHRVLGHVSGRAECVERRENNDGSVDLWLRVEHHDTVAPSIPLVHKGCLCVDGVSLTIAEMRVQRSSSSDGELCEMDGGRDGDLMAVGTSLLCRVSLIPHTLDMTTLQFARPGTPMNVEFDQELHTPGRGFRPILTNEDGVSVSVPTVRRSDDEYMREAIKVGLRGERTATPNPWVGCVLVDVNGRIIGRGFHERAGAPHAEVMAVREALRELLRESDDTGSADENTELAATIDSSEAPELCEAVRGRLVGACAYVTLEPCAHTGRTPPCAEMLAHVGVSRVVCAIEDPDERVAGSGLSFLREHGVTTAVGVCAQTVRRRLAAYIRHRETGRPLCVLKCATSVDGRVAAFDGSSQWITGEDAREHAHVNLRATSQAIVVGVGTALADEPRLTVRVKDAHREHERPTTPPLRVLVDARGQCTSGPLFQNCATHPTLVFALESADERSVEQWRASGASVAFLPASPTNDSRVDMRAALEHLANLGVLQVLVEGGPTLQAHLIEERLADRLAVYFGASAIGSRGTPAFAGGLDCSSIDERTHLRLVSCERVGESDDIFALYEIECRDGGGRRRHVGDEHDSDKAAHESSVESAIESIRRGGMVVVMDDASRENEGDLIVAARHATSSVVATMVRHTSGLLCVPMLADRAQALGLPPMVAQNDDPHGTAYTISCDFDGATTGISAKERATTARVLADAASGVESIRRPGHVLPLVARDGGVLERRGHTEAAVELCRLANIEPPVGLIAELQNDDGTMMRLKDCRAFARAHRLPLISIDALAKHVEAERETQLNSSRVELAARCALPIERGGSSLGVWSLLCFRDANDNDAEYIALMTGDCSGVIDSNGNVEPLLVRVHSACYTGDLLGSQRCDCGPQFERALRHIANVGRGVIVYALAHEGRGIGMINKIRAYSLMQDDPSCDTYEANARLGFAADLRSYDAVRSILVDHLGLGEQSIHLLTSNPDKVAALCSLVARSSPLVVEPNSHNELYMRAKRNHEKERARAVFKHDTSVDGVGPSEKQFPTTILRELVAGGRSAKPASSHAQVSVGVVRTAWNDSLVSSLVGGVRRALLASGVDAARIVEVLVPGAFELPLAAQRLTSSVDVVIACGVLLEGETAHFDVISHAVARGLMDVQLRTNTPVLDGVLNCRTVAQAEERCVKNGELASSLAISALRVAQLAG